MDYLSLHHRKHRCCSDRNVVNGCICLLPILAAIIPDSSLGCFLVASLSSSISFLGIVLLSLTALLPSLRPHPCNNIINGGSNPLAVGSSCRPSKLHLSILYTAITLESLGMAGFRFTIATVGGDQFRSSPSSQSTFFNWFYFAQYSALVVSSTVVVYVQDSVSWGLGFGLCAAANLVGTAILVMGSRYYYHHKPEGSPFTRLARVVVAAIRKRKFKLHASISSEYYYHANGDNEFLNKAALKTEADSYDGSGVLKPWRLCTVQQVEELKRLIRMIPLCSTGIFLSTPIAVQNSTVVLQALKMDRSWGPHFKVPPGTVLVLVMLSSSISLALMDKCLAPLSLRFSLMSSTGSNPSPLLAHLQRIRIGHVLNTLSMVISALVESKRLGEASPLSVAWLFPQLILVGIGEAFQLPAQVTLPGIPRVAQRQCDRNDLHDHRGRVLP
ncbi:hypothetical protein SAY87_016292 [Trapa incisa]|uniref:Uncharacterized protein n=1 Tax=Trapa incisa TaxID=236973 RepID=A0AAN7LGR0_9MYRT|nr:hypothetical protein SAY87_016292 [Trapa incisa]